MTDNTKKTRQPFWRIISENVECLAIAVVMALMINLFFMQAYKIPTGSMQPALMGNEERGIFDRVLVNKFLYLVDEPERWDVIVFKYPLDQSENYIKRLVGFPEETITIRDGDIYVDGEIERKPEGAIRATMKRLFPNGVEGKTLEDLFSLEGECRMKGKDHISFFDSGSARLKDDVRARYMDGYDPDYEIRAPAFDLQEDRVVGDLRLSFKVRLLDGGEGVKASITEGGRRHVFFLKKAGGTGSSYITTGPMTPGGERTDMEMWSDGRFGLEADRSYDLVFTHMDDRLSLHVDGEAMAVEDYRYELAEPVVQMSRVEFGSVGGGAEISDIALFRDIYYLTGREDDRPTSFQVPKGHYFGLGDNTQISVDGRYWHSVGVVLNGKERIIGNHDPMGQSYPYHERNPLPVEGGYLLRDLYGDQRFIPAYIDREPEFRYEHRPFIPRSCMLGKAMVVFWPVYPHFRCKILR